jgi:transcription antitermination factor NusG
MSETPSTSGPTGADAAAPAALSSKRWYVVHAYSGMEKAVERNLRERIDRAGMQDKFGRILVPDRRGGRAQERQEGGHRAPLLPGLRAGRDGDGRRHLAPGQAHQQGHRLRRRRAQPPGADLRSRSDEDRQPDAGRRRQAAAQGRVDGGRAGARQGRALHRLQRRGRGSQLREEQGQASRSPSSAAATPVELDFAQVEKV